MTTLRRRILSGRKMTLRCRILSGCQALAYLALMAMFAYCL